MKNIYSNEEIQELFELQNIFLTTLVEIVESKDYITGEHIRRTAEYVKIIASELQLDGLCHDEIKNGYIKNLVLAAPLHDIGKIHTPDAILNKPGRLTEEEFKTMQDHTIIGGYIIQKIIDKLPENSRFLPIFNMAHNIALYHHEKWNGKGYPDGKSELEIPLCARIMSIADVFDALTSKRCYKEAMSLDDAYQIIKDCSGESFDPKIVDVFCKNKVKERIKCLNEKNNII